MRDHEEELPGALPLGRPPAPAAAAAPSAPAAARTTTGIISISNGRPPFASSAAPASTGNCQFPSSLPAPLAQMPPPRRTPSSLPTTTLHSSSAASMMDGSVASQTSASANGGASAPFGLGVGFHGGSKRPLASLNPNSSSSSGGDVAMAGQVGGGDCSMMTTTMEDDAAHSNNTGSSGNHIPSHRGAAATGTTSPAWSAVSSAPSVPSAGPPAMAVQPSSHKRPRPTPTLTAIRHRLASKLVSAVQKTPHSDAAARPCTEIVECLDGEERRACGSCTGAANGAPHGLFFTPDQARTQEVGWEVPAGGKAKRTTATVWTLYGSAAAEWLQAAMEEGGGIGGNGGGGAQPRQPFRIHPVPYDGPVRVGYGGKRERMYAYAGVEALEARFETSGTETGCGGNGGGDGMLTLTVRTHLAGLVDEAKVTFSPWG